MAEREVDTIAEQVARTLQEEAELLRANVPESFLASDTTALNDAFLPAANTDTFSSSVHDKEAEFIRRSFEQQRGDAPSTGARELGPVAGSHAQGEEKQRERKERERLHGLMKLLDTLRDIDNQIAANTRALDAIERIRELRAQGKFDPQNEEHRRLLDTAGISVSEYERDGETALDRRERELNDENRRLREQKLDTRQELQTRYGLTEQEIDARLDSNLAASIEQQDIQQQDGVDGIEIVDTSVADHVEERRSASSSIEQELEEFVMAFARAQRIEHDAQRLAAEKVLVDGLSEDAQLLALTDDTVKHAFEPGYFDALEAPARQPSQLTPTSGGPSV